jgi:hypothetical protein
MEKSIIAAKVKRLKQVEKSIEKNKALYAELDQLTFDLKDENLAEHGLKCIDNFEEKNVQFGHGAVRRYEIVEVKPAKGK